MKLHFKTLGEGEPVIILHGLFGSADNWQTLAKTIAERFKIYLVDQRNHGHSPHAEEMSYPIMADDLKAMMDDEGLDKAIVVGHSMGGKTAIHFAANYPDRLKKLVVVDMGVKRYPPHHQIIFNALLGVNLDQVKTRKEVETHLREHILDASVVQFLLKNLYWSERERLDWRFNLPVLHRDIDLILDEAPTDRMTVPTLFIRGEKSNYILESDFEALHDQFLQSEIVTIPGAGHWVHAEAPQQFLHELMRFICN